MVAEVMGLTERAWRVFQQYKDEINCFGLRELNCFLGQHPFGATWDIFAKGSSKNKLRLKGGVSTISRGALSPLRVA